MNGILRYRFRHARPRTGNPVTDALVLIVGGVVVALALLLGVVAFLALAGIVVMLGAVLGIRLWWHQRRLRRDHRRTAERPAAAAGRRRKSVEIIEGEYRVVSRKRRDGKRP